MVLRYSCVGHLQHSLELDHRPLTTLTTFALHLDHLVVRVDARAHGSTSECRERLPHVKAPGLVRTAPWRAVEATTRAQRGTVAASTPSSLLSLRGTPRPLLSRAAGALPPPTQLCLRRSALCAQLCNTEAKPCKSPREPSHHVNAPAGHNYRGGWCTLQPLSLTHARACGIPLKYA